MDWLWTVAPIQAALILQKSLSALAPTQDTGRFLYILTDAILVSGFANDGHPRA